MDNQTTNRRTGFGLILITIGLILTLKVFGLFPNGIFNFIFQWEMILIVIGLYKMRKGDYQIAFTLFAIALFFLIVSNINLILWPILLIVLGFVLIFNKNDKKYLNQQSQKSNRH